MKCSEFKKIKGEVIYLLLCLGWFVYTILCSIGFFSHWQPSTLQYVLEILLIIGSLLRIRKELKQ